jgi:hypothetical protein
MSIRIEINLADPDVSATALAQHMEALGFARTQPILSPDLDADLAGFKAEQESDAKPNIGFGMDLVKDEGPRVDTTVVPAKRTRRTKAEIEADKAKEVVKELDQAAVAEERAITSSPEDRKQDEADEAAEKTEELTTDSVRKLAGDYVAKFGIAAANEDGHRVFTAALGPVPADLTDTKGAPVTQWRMSVIPSDADSLRKMVHAWEEALETNPFDRTAVS